MEIRICQVEGCQKVVKPGQGFICSMHRMRMFRHGSYDLPYRPLTEPYMMKDGYLRVYKDGRYYLQHRLVMEQHLGRELTAQERIHHINGDRADNRIENLELMPSASEHMWRYHMDTSEKLLRDYPHQIEDGIKHQIKARLALPMRTHTECFCGRPINGRNLCKRHYEWARNNGLFVPRKYNRTT